MCLSRISKKYIFPFLCMSVFSCYAFAFDAEGAGHEGAFYTVVVHDENSDVDLSVVRSPPRAGLLGQFQPTLLVRI